MQNKSKTLKRITETTYLNTENTARYRALMRIFYRNDQSFRHWLKKEQVYQQLQSTYDFDEYTLELCASDLDKLVEWGNLTTVQDTSKVSTYQQFINKQYRYQMTEYAIEIERMTIKLENISVEGGSLEPTLLERICEEITKLESIDRTDHKALSGWWRQLTADFQRLNQNYQDYIRDWHSAKTDELLKTKKFLIYKEKLVEYLRGFIVELQIHAQKIEGVLNAQTAEAQSELCQSIGDAEWAFRMLRGDELTKAELSASIVDKFNNILRFFTSKQGERSEVEQILEMTNEIIRRITRYAANIMEVTNQYTNRKDEYAYIAACFLEQDDLDCCHQLAAQVFGVTHYMHFTGDFERDTDSITSSIYSESPHCFELAPRIQTYREKTKKTAIVEHSQKKQALREKIFKQRQLERQTVEDFVVQGRLDFKVLPQLEAPIRKILLRWLSKGLRSNGASVTTEHGARFKIVNPTEKSRCILDCTDGKLDMPAYILEFEGDYETGASTTG